MASKPASKVGKKPKFFITTPIYYINSPPSVGSAYTTIIADVLAKWHKLKGEEVFFLTGLDENSVKTVKSAKEAGYQDIQKYADDMAKKWVAVWKRLGIDYDDFIRTTEERHKKFVQDFFLKIMKNGDIEKGKYEGLYCEGCEAYYLEKDLIDGKCPYHKTVPNRISEENYFFKLSRFQKKLIDHIKKNPGFIMPVSRRNEVISFIEGGLKDISVTRPNLEWGISIPALNDEKQKVWVWLDALGNYISASPESWPATLHLVGKDILKFHCVFWPAFLMSAGYKLPKTVFAHGFFTVNGQKMSKSLGNVVDPVYLADTYGVDTLRYYLLREIPFGEDGDFSEQHLIERHNTELANGLGNLVNRTISLTEQKLNGVIPNAKFDAYFFSKLDLATISGRMDSYDLSLALQEIFAFINICNKYVNDKKPWALEGAELEKVLYSLLDSIRLIAILLYPYIPQTSEQIFKQLNIDKKEIKLEANSNGELKSHLSEYVNLLKAGTRLGQKEILFKKIEMKK